MRTDLDAMAMQAALDALQTIWDDGLENYPEPAHSRAIATLRERLAAFNPDWDKLAATQESLREHMAEIRVLRNLVCSLLYQPMTDERFAAIRDEALKTIHRDDK